MPTCVHKLAVAIYNTHHVQANDATGKEKKKNSNMAC